jgi:hypothetical protein
MKATRKRHFFAGSSLALNTSLCEIIGWEKTSRGKSPNYRALRLGVLTRAERQRLDELIDACKPTEKMSCKLGACAWKYPSLCTPKTRESVRDVERFVIAVEDRIAGRREMWIYSGQDPRYTAVGDERQWCVMDNKTGRKVRGSAVTVARMSAEHFIGVRSRLEAQARMMNWQADRRQ